MKWLDGWMEILLLNLKDPYWSPYFRGRTLVLTDLFRIVAVQNQTYRFDVEVKSYGLQSFSLLFFIAYSWLFNFSCITNNKKKIIISVL